MLRSLIAIIAAVLVGLIISKFVESTGQSALGQEAEIFAGHAPSGVYQAILLAGWMAGAFFAGVIALLIGRRWAPLGALAAGTMFFSAIIAQASFSLSWLLLPAAALVTAAGGYAAIRLLGATNQYPAPGRNQDIFND